MRPPFWAGENEGIHHVSYKRNVVHLSGRVSATDASPKGPTEAGVSVKAQLEKPGVSVEVNEQGEIVLIDLSFAPITDAGLVNLAGLTNLEHLWFHNLVDTRITGTGLTKLRKALPKCQIEYLAPR